MEGTTLVAAGSGRDLRSVSTMSGAFSSHSDALAGAFAKCADDLILVLRSPLPFVGHPMLVCHLPARCTSQIDRVSALRGGMRQDS
jgi:hypothetical protein